MPRIKSRKKAVRGRPSGQVATRDNILRAAIDVFAKNGFAGGRVEKISKAANSTDRMIYYYFGSKESLFVAVLETIYQQLGDAEAALDLSGLNAEQALREIIRFTWNHYLTHPEMLSLLSNENLYQGRHLARSKRAKELSFPLIAILSDVLARGVKQKTFRANIAATDLYIAMCSLGYFYLSNKFTLATFLGVDLMATKALDHWREIMEMVILRFVQQSDALA